MGFICFGLRAVGVFLGAGFGAGLEGAGLAAGSFEGVGALLLLEEEDLGAKKLEIVRWPLAKLDWLDMTWRGSIEEVKEVAAGSTGAAAVKLELGS